jgi:hypothetical protein
MRDPRSRFAAVIIVMIGLLSLPGVASASPQELHYRQAVQGGFTTQAACDASRIGRNDPPDLISAPSCDYNSANMTWSYGYRYLID